MTDKLTKIALSDDDFDAFSKALDNPPQPNEALKKLMSSDMVERLSKSLEEEFCLYGFDFGTEFAREIARLALKESHHADIVADNERLRIALRQIHDLADDLLSDIEAEEAQA